jgi:hypothetical protein
MPHRSFRAGVAILLVVPAIATAQATPLTKGERFFDANLSVSFHSDVGPHFALLRNKNVVTLGLKRERVLRVGPKFALSHTIEIPISVILPPSHAQESECWWRSTTGKRECYDVIGPNYPVAGVGVTPLALKLYYGPTQPFRLFGAVGIGGVAFDRKTPVAAASVLNFAIEYLLGAELGITDRRSVEIAWKYQHWSNANTTYFNPGLDVNLITVGLKTRR